MAAQGSAAPAAAQSAIWDATISNTHWYVPVPQLLAYAAPKTGFTNPIPIGDPDLVNRLGVFDKRRVHGDQHRKACDRAGGADGRVPAFRDLSRPPGQITMVFTADVEAGLQPVGLGRMRISIKESVPEMEMQMITGDSLLVTHLAYMLPYDPATFRPPPPAPVPANSVQHWAWTAGTPWRIVSPAMFGTTSPGRFVITNYQNGYFWGTGVGPSGNFTLLGSVTPEARCCSTLCRRQSDQPVRDGDRRRVRFADAGRTYDLTGNPTTGGGVYFTGSALRRTAARTTGPGSVRRTRCADVHDVGQSNGPMVPAFALDNVAAQKTFPMPSARPCPCWPAPHRRRAMPRSAPFEPP
jgi:hypothetical protein